MRKRRGLAAGYTLVELLVVIAIVAIMSTIAISSYKNITTRDRMLSEIGDLNSDIELARSTAIKQGVTVTICAAVTKSDTTAANTGTCSASATGWNSGWIVFTDVNGTAGAANQTYAAATGDTLLRIHPALQGGDTLNTALPSLTFNRMGATANAGTLSLHDAQNTASWSQCLMVSKVGVATSNIASACP